MGIGSGANLLLGYSLASVKMQEIAMRKRFAEVLMKIVAVGVEDDYSQLMYGKMGNLKRF